MLSIERLKELLEYNRDTGEWRWLKTLRPQSPAGCIAGSKGKEYTLLRVDRRAYMAHKLAWLYCYGDWPAKQIDHINGDRYDNRIVNLRLATPSENGRNRGPQRNNTSGVKGVTWHARDKRWQAQIWVNGKRIQLGYFIDIKDAAAAYAKAALELHGEFARLTPPDQLGKAA